MNSSEVLVVPFGISAFLGYSQAPYAEKEKKTLIKQNILNKFFIKLLDGILSFVHHTLSDYRDLI